MHFYCLQGCTQTLILEAFITMQLLAADSGLTSSEAVWLLL